MATGGSNPTRLYTRTGDRGETGLAGGARIAKDSARIRAFGALDELGAQLGVVGANLPSDLPEVTALVTRLQHELYVAQAELAALPGSTTAGPRVSARHVERLEREIDRYSAMIEPVRSFVLPRGKRAGAHLHVARTVARRAERELWALNAAEPVRPELAQWLNRMSDLLFALALSVNHHEGVPEIAPDYSV